MSNKKKLRPNKATALIEKLKSRDPDAVLVGNRAFRRSAEYGAYLDSLLESDEGNSPE